jgi:putative DNA methylase
MLAVIRLGCGPTERSPRHRAEHANPPNAARLKSVTELKPRDLTDRTEIGPTPLGALIVAILELLAEKDPEVVMANRRDAVEAYLAKLPVLMDMADFVAAKARSAEVRRAAEAIASRIRHQRLQ